MLTLVIGGARSGKSRLAQSLCPASARVAYVATARVEDGEMRARVARHRQQRPAHWLTFEEPLALDAAVDRALPESEVLLIDCLTVWLSNLQYQHRKLSADRMEAIALAQLDHVIAAAARCHLILVSNEVGCGIVPMTKVGRLFRDLQGRVNQYVAARADRVILTVAGIPLQIKPPSSLQPLSESS